MTQIILNTTIKAPIEEVFNLSRDIDFHKETASYTNETVIDGIKSGRIGLDEEVHWKGKHFGLYLKHRSKITKYIYPTLFTDEMIKGHFNYFVHKHSFRESDTKTHMQDQIYYEVPYGIIGKFIDDIFIKKHLTNFLKNRNNALKNRLES